MKEFAARCWLTIKGLGCELSLEWSVEVSVREFSRDIIIQFLKLFVGVTEDRAEGGPSADPSVNKTSTDRGSEGGSFLQSAIPSRVAKKSRDSSLPHPRQHASE